MAKKKSDRFTLRTWVSESMGFRDQEASPKGDRRRTENLSALADVGAIVGDPATPCRAMIDQPCRSHCHPKHAHLADEASS